jgi:hypothetical protein
MDGDKMPRLCSKGKTTNKSNVGIFLGRYRMTLMFPFEIVRKSKSFFITKVLMK